MLQRVDLTSQWRSLGPGFWPSTAPAGKHTVIYGHNGSGKSTLASLFLQLTEEKLDSPVDWHSPGEAEIIKTRTRGTPSTRVSVFTRSWVSRNLGAFLQGEGAEAIVTLGEEAIETKKLVDQLTIKRDELKGEVETLELSHKRASSAAYGVAHNIQDQIVDQLQSYDYTYFTKHRFTAPTVARLLQQTGNNTPSAEDYSDAVRTLAQRTPAKIALDTPPGLPASICIDAVEDVLRKTPSGQTIETLKADPPLQSWVEQGIALHADSSHCKFCTSEIPAARLDALLKHFDDSWTKIRTEAATLLVAATKWRGELEAWKASIPVTTDVIVSLQESYMGAAHDASESVNARIDEIRALERLLQAKVDEPGATDLALSVGSDLASSIQVQPLLDLIIEHNNRVSRHDSSLQASKKIAIDYLVDAAREGYRTLRAAELKAKEDLDSGRDALERAEQELGEAEESRFTTSAMATALTSDLARVYGRNHLSVVVAPDGKSYFCRRGNAPATHLSEGEQMSLALLYFLRKAEEEGRKKTEGESHLVVIDDPSSSLDREAIYSTHQWLIESVGKFDQSIILTHDFNLLRLLLTSRKSRWEKSLKSIREQATDGVPSDTLAEREFPAVSFLEIYASETARGRGSRIAQLPKMLSSSTSEYAYLFSAVAQGVIGGHEHDRLFLLPNAARRVLEVFASYKAPHSPKFLQQLEILMQAAPGEPFRDVYDFCNRFSHGEGAETVEILDARVVHHQLRRCLEFLQAVDSEHFHRLCKATKTDPNFLTT